MSASNALMTLSELKQKLGITTTDDDFKLTDLISAASEMIERYCETAFIKRSFVEQHTGGSKYMFLRRYPIVGVPMIVDPAGNKIPQIDFTVLPDKGILKHFGRFWTAQTDQGLPTDWTVSYVAGRFDNVYQVTADLKQACVWLVDYHKDLPISPGEASSVGVGGLSVSYVAGADTGGVPQTVKGLLASYRSGSSMVA